MRFVQRGQSAERGFLLLVIVGMLAIMLVLCVSFLSLTRSETQAVVSIRDKADAQDACRSALDYVLANITTDLFKNTGDFDPTKTVSFARTNGNWWYRPYEKDLSKKFAQWPGAPPGWLNWAFYSWKNAYGPVCPDCVDTAGTDQAEWIWFPEDFYPSAGVRARAMVQVLDPNAFPLANDWLEDCNPTQCQMAHMIRDGYGEQRIDQYREHRDSTAAVASAKPDFYRQNGTVLGFGQLTAGGAGWSVKTQPLTAPLRYHEVWRAASRTVRYPQWINQYGGSGIIYDRDVTPNWTTTNTPWLSGYGMEMACIRALLPSDGIYPGAQNAYVTDWPTVASGNAVRYFPPTPNEGAVPSGTYSQEGGRFWNGLSGQAYLNGTRFTTGLLPLGMPFSMKAYVDPDTGRAPINVNTCYNSGERLPTNLFNGTPEFAMEAVFNIDSLRRIIKINSFVFDANLDGTLTDTPGAPATTERINTQDLVAFMNDPASFDNDPTNDKIFNATPPPQPAPLPPLTPVPPFWPPAALSTGTPAQTAAAKRALAAMAWMKHEELRTKLAYRYQEMLCRYFTATYRHPQSRRFPAFGGANFNFVAFGWPETEVYSTPGNFVAVYGASTGVSNYCKAYDYAQPRFPVSLTKFRQDVRDDLAKMAPAGAPTAVDFDATDTVTNFNVDNGYMDARTANAVFDNIVPGKPGQNGNPAFPNATGGDPLMELFTERLGRDELSEDPFESGWTPLDFPGAGAQALNFPSDATDGDRWTDLNTFFNLASITAAQKKNMIIYTRSNRGYFCDDPRMFDSGNSSWGGIDPASTSVDPTNTKQSYVTGIGASRFLNIRPKGRDISVGNNIPWAQNRGPNDTTALPKNIKQGVPYRQLAFGPDWFSTELTTTTTNFIIIVTIQLVDGASADPAKGGNWNTPRPFYTGQWGFNVELAPDVICETPAAVSGKNWPDGAGNAAECGLGFYRGTPNNLHASLKDQTWPGYLKRISADPTPTATDKRTFSLYTTDPAEVTKVVNGFPQWLWSVDAKCSTLKVMRQNKTSRRDSTDTYETVPPQQSRDSWTDSYGTRYRKVSAARSWIDFRGLTALEAANYYSDTGGQTKKRVIIRSVWSHNQGQTR